MASRRQGGLKGISEELVGRINELPGAKSLLDGVNTLRERVDELQKRMRGLDELTRRIDALERRVDQLSGKKGSTRRGTARKSTSSRSSDTALSVSAYRARDCEYVIVLMTPTSQLPRTRNCTWGLEGCPGRQVPGAGQSRQPRRSTPRARSTRKP